MKRRINLLSFIMVALILPYGKSIAQDDLFKVKFSGFIKTDAFYDTRNVVSLREGHVHLWPLGKSLDKTGEDLNENGNFNILSVQSRLAAKVEGPGIWGGKTSGYVETEFLGTTDGDINSLRLRHAFVDLDFDNFQIRAGQFWHPMFSTDNFPDVLNFNTGIPFIPFNRAPQIKLTQKFDDFKVFLAVNSQRDFTVDGPDGYSPKYVKNSGIPEASLGMSYYTPTFSWGLVGAAKTILPFSSIKFGNDVYKNDDKFTSFSGSANIRGKIDKFHIKAQANYFQNSPDFLTLGGYGVKSIDTANVEIEYTPISSVSGWLELMYKDKWEFGVVGGMAQNLGASDDVMAVYGRGLDIDKIIKVFPRIAYNFNKTKIGLETEWTAAYYGKKISAANKKVENAEAVNNLRVLLAFYVFF